MSIYLPQCNASMKHEEIAFQEFKKAFKMLKRNKVIGCGGLSSNIITDVYDSKASFEEAVFPENLKSQKLFQFLKRVKKKMLKTTDQFLFFQYFPKCLNV